MKQWSICARDANSDVEFLVVSADAVNEHLGFVTVVPVVPRTEDRRIYMNEAVVARKDRFSSENSTESIVMAHQLQTVRSGELQEERGTIEQPETRRAILDALEVQFNLRITDPELQYR